MSHPQSYVQPIQLSSSSSSSLSLSSVSSAANTTNNTLNNNSTTTAITHNNKSSNQSYRNRSDEIILFDIETNINPTEIVEFGAMIVDKMTFVELQRYSTFIKNVHPMTQKAIECHGITDEVLINAPLFNEVAPIIYDLLDGRIWMGHNIRSFDIPHLKNAFATWEKNNNNSGNNNNNNDNLSFPTPKRIVDTLLLTRKILLKGTTKNYKMATLGNFYGLGEEEHRAVSDCVMTLQVLQRAALAYILDLEDQNLIIDKNKQQHGIESTSADIHTTTTTTATAAATPTITASTTPAKTKTGNNNKKKNKALSPIEQITSSIQQLNVSRSLSDGVTDNKKLPSKSPRLNPHSPAFIPSSGMANIHASPKLVSLSPMAKPFQPSLSSNIQSLSLSNTGTSTTSSSSSQPSPSLSSSIPVTGTIFRSINSPQLPAVLEDMNQNAILNQQVTISSISSLSNNHTSTSISRSTSFRQTLLSNSNVPQQQTTAVSSTIFNNNINNNNAKNNNNNNNKNNNRAGKGKQKSNNNSSNNNRAQSADISSSSSNNTNNDGWEQVVSKKTKKEEKDRQQQQYNKQQQKFNNKQKLQRSRSDGSNIGNTNVNQVNNNHNNNSNNANSSSLSSSSASTAPYISPRLNPSSSPRLQPLLPTWSAKFFPTGSVTNTMIPTLHTNNIRSPNANNNIKSPISPITLTSKRWTNEKPSPENVALLHTLLEYGMHNPKTIFWLKYSGGQYPDIERQCTIIQWQNKPHSFLAHLLSSPQPHTHFTTSKVTMLRIHE